MDAERARVERWFTRRGLPHFIVDYSAREDIFTRAAPLLAWVFVAEILSALRADFAWWANTLALAGGLLIALAGLALVNTLRGRRPLQRPDTIGALELTAFVVVPPVIPLVAGAQVRAALVLLIGNLILLAVVYLVTSYGVLPTIRWAAGRLAAHLGALADLAARSLPLVLLFSMFFFLNAELWRIMSDLPAVLYGIAVGVLVLLGVTFVVLSVPRRLSELSWFTSWDEVTGTVRELDADDLRGMLEIDPSDGLPPSEELGRRERANVALVFFFSQSTQIALLTSLVFVFYVLFGVLVINETTVEFWTGAAPDEIARVSIFGEPVLVSDQLLRVAGFLAAVVGLQFTVATLTDRTYRQEFGRDIDTEVREAFAVRELYREAIRTGTAPAPVA